MAAPRPGVKRKAVGRKADGYSASASRTVAAPVTKLFAAWSDAKVRARWLPRVPMEIRRANDGMSMRIQWAAGDSSVEVTFYPGGNAKSRVQVSHFQLADADAVAEQKAFWGGALDRMKALLEPAAR